MKFKMYLFTLLLSVIPYAIHAEEKVIACKSEGPLCKTIEECEDINNPCTCYCSEKCGPRDKSTIPDEEKDADKPYVKDGVCFCQQRDEDNYKPHKCDISENPGKSIKK